MNSSIRQLIEYLNYCTSLYDAGTPIISDKEWDDKLLELQQLEEKTGIYYPDSPSVSVPFVQVSALKKVTHNHPMLSLPKSKDLAVFDPTKGYIAMPKMDGLTCSLRYVDGVLVSAETRGDGHIGEDVLHNVLAVKNVPGLIGYKDELIVDGEIICKYQDFEPFAEQYKNPRNFAAGSIRLLNNQESANRNLSFIVWDVIKGYDEEKSLLSRLGLVSTLGFECVFNVEVGVNDPEITVSIIKSVAHSYGYPIDGIVLKIDDYDKRMAEEGTAHHLGGAIAYKFYDEEYPTVLRGIDWTMGRTGELTPVAVFDPVDTDESIIERASVHNISIMTELAGGSEWRIGDELMVAKMNQIIPQITKWIPGAGELLTIPAVCPVCGGETQIQTSDSGVQTLVCTSPMCSGKLVNRLDHFCGKKGLDIKGLSKATLTKLTDWGWIDNINDIPKLEKYKSQWVKKPGFGEKSVQNILNAIGASLETADLAKFITALGIPLIGSTIAKEIAKREITYTKFREDVKNRIAFSDWAGFGPEMQQALWDFDYTNADFFYESYLSHYEAPTQIEERIETPQTFEGKTFVITGKLQNFKNRNEMKEVIEAHGGKVVESVSSKTSYLINNDIDSTSSKNVTARKLGTPIITEKELLLMIACSEENFQNV